MAVIYRTECIRLGKMIQGIVLVLVLTGATHSVRANPQQDCEQARKDIRADNVPSNAIQDGRTSGGICGENSCCTSVAERSMQSERRDNIEIFLKDSISKLSSLFDMRARKFDGIFKQMLNTSRMDFHDMFQKTYGKIYLQNSDVFSDFFVELESYYKKGAIRLSDTLEAFFGVLYQRMFTVINSQYTFDAKYLECVSEHMKQVKPFGDVPHKFTLQLRRSFVATRIYYKALDAAAEAAKRISSAKVDKECQKELVKMRYCGSCKGLRGMGPCSDYCAAVVGACLRHYTALSSEWDNFVEALDKVADRLIGPYSIEMVVEPLNIKISEAIMNFQESGTEVSKKIYGFCGKPTLSKRKRDVNSKDDVETNPSLEIQYAPMKMQGHKKKKTKKHEEPSFQKLIKEIKLKVRETRQFWAHLPYQYCNNMTAPLTSDDQCWNGTSLGKYTKSTTTKPPITVSPLVQEQNYTLHILTFKLRRAYDGDEVEIIDDSDDNADGSGSGSGDFEIDDNPEHEFKYSKAEIDKDMEVRNEIPAEAQPLPSTNKPKVTRTYVGGASSISLSRALIQYLLPIVFVWFGGAITDLL